MDRQTWDTARICLNGHVLTSHLSLHPDVGNYCKRCGAKAIDHCPLCDAPVKGEPFHSFGSFKPPRFCDNCGEPYPWADKVDEVLAEKLMRRTSLFHWSQVAKSKTRAMSNWLRRRYWRLFTAIALLIGIIGGIVQLVRACQE